jgi:phosphinothricin acetyltransferase
VTVAIDELAPADWPDARRIYEEGIASGDGTFESRSPKWEAWNRAHLSRPRLAARDDGRLCGWAALTAYSAREVYAGVAEVSIYVAASARGRGVGRALLSELVRRSEQTGIWTLQAGIFPENGASLRIHERCGFRLVGRRERIGRHPDGRWRDVLLFERRSATVGI